MLLMLRKRLSLLIFSLSLITPALGQSNDVKDFALALVRLKSETDQEQMFAQKQELRNGALLTALKTLADQLAQKGDYNEALRISHLAVRVAEKVGDRPLLGTALCDLGALYARRIPPKDAVVYLEKSLAIFQEAGMKGEEARALAAMGDAYENDRRRDLAIQYYKKSLALSEELGDRKLAARIFIGLGQTYSYLGDADAGMSFFQKARAISEDLNDKLTLGIVLNHIATHYISQGSYAEALEYLNKSIKATEEVGTGVDRRSVAARLQNIGLIYRRQGNLDQALAYARKTLTIYEEIDDKFGIANLQNNIGVIYKSQGVNAQALEWFEKALHGYEALNNTPGVARSFNNIGDSYRQQGRHAEALEALQKGLKLREQSGDRGGMLLSLNNLGRLYREQHKYKEMLDVSRQAAKLAEDSYSREDLWVAQEHLGRALLEMGEPAKARDSFLAAIAAIESLRREVAGGEQQQQVFLENRLAPWLGMVEVLVSQGNEAEALTFAEQSKARVLLDALQTGRPNVRRSWSRAEQQKEEQQRMRLVSLNTQLATEARREKSDVARVAELKAALQNARLEYEDFKTQLYVAHPELKVERGEAPIIKAEELTGLLPNSSTALLEFVVSEEATYLFVVTKQTSGAEIRAYTLPVKRIELARQTEALREQLAGRDLAFRASASKLYELLLKPAEAQLRGTSNLVIVPDSTLWDLPFQALVNGAHRFMIEDVAIAYAPSLTVLREMTKRKSVASAHASPRTLLAFGNPLIGTETLKKAALTVRDEKLNPLPEAEQEVKALRRLYGESRSKVYVGADAREDHVKSEASAATILHFATHGILNNAAPMYSHLALAEGSANEDGLLEAWELMQLDLHADLAVLSACETARGRFGAGEGMIGFSWAMLMAGVPSIIVSQWKVESASTRDLMVTFHRGLISSNTKTEALRQASLKLLRNPETSHPFYWAGFVLVGDGR
jgi:CHAT domain-containing protein/tetratricopeptide (TPR) repeat protein